MEAVRITRLTRQEAEAVEQAAAYINQHYPEKITADSLSVDFGIAVKKLQAGLKKRTGHTVQSYLLQVRVENAKKLLSDTDEPLKTIAGKIGYSKPSHFGQFFKKLTGETPQAYRLRYGT